MSTSSYDYITNSAKSVLERQFPESSIRQRRIQELVIETENMEKSLSVLEFGEYYHKLLEMKDLLLDELVTVCTTVRKQVLDGFNRHMTSAVMVQDVELERLNVVVNEKNKAISTLANENEAEKEEFRSAQLELKELREKVSSLESRVIQQKSFLLKSKKSDSAREDEIVEDIPLSSPDWSQ